MTGEVSDETGRWWSGAAVGRRGRFMQCSKVEDMRDAETDESDNF